MKRILLIVLLIGNLLSQSTHAVSFHSELSVPQLSVPVTGNATDITATSFVANWTPVENAVGYEVMVYWGSSILTIQDIIGQSNSSLLVTNLIPDKSYTYKVVAKGDSLSYFNSNPSEASPVFRLLIPTIRPQSPKIILKLDDFQGQKGSSLATTIMNVLKEKQVKAAFGTIALRFDSTAPDVLNSYINSKNDDGEPLFEIWHHGLDHVNPEFKGTTYEYQKLHFDSATQIIKNLLGIQMHSFGTPYNASDAITNTVISEDSNYKVFMLPSINAPASTGILNLKHRVNIEISTGEVDFAHFVTNYNTYKDTYKDYMLLQGHPNNWTAAKIEQMNQILLFLASQNCEFVLPYEYYLSLSLTAPTGFTAEIQQDNKIKLSWQENTTSEYNYIVERSENQEDWSNIATCPQVATTYTDESISVGKKYYYRVCSSCGIKSGYSNIVEINFTSNDINTTKNPKKQVFSIYPNPCKDKLTINYNLSGLVTCDLLDLSGKLQKRLFSENHACEVERFVRIDCADIPVGIYLCRLNSDYLTLFRANQ